jgi:hypothetical protein
VDRAERPGTGAIRLGIGFRPGRSGLRLGSISQAQTGIDRFPRHRQVTAPWKDTMGASRREDKPIFDESVADHRRRTRRQERHQVHLSTATLDEDQIDCLPPARSVHDVGRKTSSPPPRDPQPGRRAGFKVWKTPFWKRRTELRIARNRELRRIAELD